MVDALVSGASVERRAGSSPVLGTPPTPSSSSLGIFFTKTLQYEIPIRAARRVLAAYRI